MSWFERGPLFCEGAREPVKAEQIPGSAIRQGTRRRAINRTKYLFIAFPNAGAPAYGNCLKFRGSDGVVKWSGRPRITHRRAQLKIRSEVVFDCAVKSCNFIRSGAYVGGGVNG